MAAAQTGATRSGLRRAARSRLMGCLLVAGAAAAGGAALGFTAAPHSAVASRRGVLLGGAAALSLQPQVAFAASAQWKEDIPRALSALKDFQKNWAKINREGQERAGGEIIRKTLLTTYTQEMEISLPGGDSVGATLSGNIIKSVSDSNKKWMDGDAIIGVNGQAVTDEFLLKKIIDDAKAQKESLTFKIQRSWPTPFTDFERKLQTAYGALEDPDLPELEAVQVRIGNLKALAGVAAGAPSSADETLKTIRKEIDALVGELTPVVKAIA